MAKFTKALRQEIALEFATRHNGQFNPALFVDHVQQTGPDHPAYSWFEWDRDRASRNWWVEQAREFVRDLRVTFTVEDIGNSRPVSVRERELPFVLSPLDGRERGGGYFLADPDNPEHMAEHCRQAAKTLVSWLSRYRSAVDHAGGSVSAIEKQIKTLEAAGLTTADAA